MNKTQLRHRVESMLNEAWTEPGFCVPNLSVYPHQWLWDSCFHALIWAELGDERCVVELKSALASQYGNGFVPHMTYWSQPDLHKDFWGRSETSSITQPPMYGHAAAELYRRGFEIDSDLLQRIEKAFRHLLVSRSRTTNGLVPIYHPWESGCDDSPRWDPTDTTAPVTRFDPKVWRGVKGDMVGSLVHNSDGSPEANPLFEVGSSGFNALVLFNFEEFCSIPAVADSPTIGELQTEYDKLHHSFVESWSESHQTWVDDTNNRSSTVQTADALLGLLVDPRSAGFDQLRSPRAFSSPFGVAGVHQYEPTYDPMTYWRGPSWPQLNYLLTLATRRAKQSDLASILHQTSVNGADHSGLAEYWSPETGIGLGATPQTWAGLAIVST